MDLAIQRHIEQWKHNRGFLARIGRDYSDWIVTVTFYTALHAVYAMLAHDQVHAITSHDARNGVLMRTNRYQQIQRHYMPLYSLSRTVRYLADPSRWVPPDQVEAQVIRRYLYPIERSVQKLLNQEIGLPQVELRTS